MVEVNSSLFYEIAEVQLIYKKPPSKAEPVIVTEAVTAYEVFKQTWDKNKIDLVEEFKVLLLRQNNSCIGVAHIATGGMSSVIADPRIIFATALKANAAAIILAHNHPSGNTKPSQQDMDLTDKLVEGGKLLDLKVLDHIILTSKGYLSMGNNGFML
jgi:DNA repair protein RadC